MPWPEAMAPVRMERIALLAPSDTLRDALVRVADAGVVQFDDVGARDDSAASEAAQRLQRLGSIRPDAGAVGRRTRIWRNSNAPVAQTYSQARRSWMSAPQPPCTATA